MSSRQELAPSRGPNRGQDPRPDANPEIAPQRIPDQELVSGDRPLRLLLVEDNDDDAFLLERHLRKNGFTPETTRVETAAEMTAALQSDPLPEVILADYNLPHFSGPAALSLLKKAELDIPFIMLSGAISEETAVESMRAGAQDYVTKQNLARLIPILLRELREATARRNRLAAELALVASESRFVRLVEAMPIGLLISDATGRITFANQAIERLLGYPVGSMSTGTLRRSDLLPSLEPQADQAAATQADQAAATQAHGTASTQAHGAAPGRAGDPVETRLVTREGLPLDALVGIAPLNPESTDAARLTAAFVVDLTLQKRSEEVLRRTEKLTVAGRLAASIAHEINNPLEAITNCLYLVGQTALTPDGQTYLALAQEELDRVAQITVQTLRFYRRSTSTGATDIHELLQTVLTLLDSRLRRSQITVERRFGDIPAIIAHDGELRQVLANLIGNAIDALPAGGRLLLHTAVSRHWITGRPGIRISIADNGTGMIAQTLSRIFEPFYSTKGITGTGLGLWISRDIIEKHEGTLRVRSRPAADGCPGSTVFGIFLPHPPPIEAAAARDDQSAPEPT